MSVSFWWVLAAAMAGATLGFVLCAALTLSARCDRDGALRPEVAER